MRITSLLFGLFMLCCQGALAQDFTIPKHQLSISYFGEMLTHKGIRLGFSSSIRQSIKEKKNAKLIHKGWVLGGFLTYYNHPRNHSGIMLTGAIGQQRVGEKGFQTSFNFEAGYMLSSLDGEVFSWEDNRITEANKNSSHIVFGFNAGVGWNFEKQSNLPVSFMLQPHLYFQAPYNSIIAPRVALETKLSYFLK